MLDLIDPFVIAPSVAYKSRSGRVTSLVDTESIRSAVPVKVTRVQYYEPWLYDLTVDGTHRYFAQHMLVHNTTHAFAAGYSPRPEPRESVDMSDMAIAMRGLGALLRLVHFNTPDAPDATGKGGVTLGSNIDRHSSTFDQGVFTMAEIKDLYVNFRGAPMILEGTPDLAADVVNFLRWELEIKTGIDPLPTPAI